MWPGREKSGARRTKNLMNECMVEIQSEDEDGSGGARVFKMCTEVSSGGC